MNNNKTYILRTGGIRRKCTKCGAVKLNDAGDFAQIIPDPDDESTDWLDFVYDEDNGNLSDVYFIEGYEPLIWEDDSIMRENNAAGYCHFEYNGGKISNIYAYECFGDGEDMIVGAGDVYHNEQEDSSFIQLDYDGDMIDVSIDYEDDRISAVTITDVDDYFIMSAEIEWEPLSKCIKK